MKRSDSNSLLSCDIFYKEIKDKVTLECKHELCIACFLEITTSSSFKCHMCRRKYNWKNEVGEELEEILEERLELLIREDDENQFLSVLGYMNKAFEVIINRQNIFQFIVVLETQIDTETLKFLISEFIANNYTEEDIIGNLRGPFSITLEIPIHIWNRSMTILF